MEPQHKYLHPSPLPGYPIIAPVTPPLPGQVIVGYEVVDAQDSVFKKPEPNRMNRVGWFSLIALLICFWPAACIPCFTTCSYTPSQRPVYGYVGYVGFKQE